MTRAIADRLAKAVSKVNEYERRWLLAHEVGAILEDHIQHFCWDRWCFQCGVNGEEEINWSVVN